METTDKIIKQLQDRKDSLIRAVQRLSEKIKELKEETCKEKEDKSKSRRDREV